MVSIAPTVWHAARNLSVALMLLVLGVHPSFSQIVAFGASNTAGYGVGLAQPGQRGSRRCFMRRDTACRSPMRVFRVTPRLAC
jgi:hypothetical protein